jgi:hypothetical protein
MRPHERGPLRKNDTIQRKAPHGLVYKLELRCSPIGKSGEQTPDHFSEHWWKSSGEVQRDVTSARIRQRLIIGERQSRDSVGFIDACKLFAARDIDCHSSSRLDRVIAHRATEDNRVHRGAGLDVYQIRAVTRQRNRVAIRTSRRARPIIKRNDRFSAAAGIDHVVAELHLDRVAAGAADESIGRACAEAAPHECRAISGLHQVVRLVARVEGIVSSTGHQRTFAVTRYDYIISRVDFDILVGATTSDNRIPWASTSIIEVHRVAGLKHDQRGYAVRLEIDRIGTGSSGFEQYRCVAIQGHRTAGAAITLVVHSAAHGEQRRVDRF